MAACATCGSELRPGAAFCASCGSPATPAQTTCSACGQKTQDPQGYCSYCGAAPSGQGTTATQHVQYAPPVSTLGAPGVGVAGFVLSLLGFSILGIILSWVGLSQAKREGRPTGLCVAGIVIGFVWLAISIILIIVTVAAVDSASTYYYE